MKFSSFEFATISASNKFIFLLFLLEQKIKLPFRQFKKSVPPSSSKNFSLLEKSKYPSFPLLFQFEISKHFPIILFLFSHNAIEENLRLDEIRIRQQANSKSGHLSRHLLCLRSFRIFEFSQRVHSLRRRRENRNGPRLAKTGNYGVFHEVAQEEEEERRCHPGIMSSITIFM